jgi:hypothetical protein
MCPPRCFATNERHLLFGSGFGQEVVDAGFSGDRRGGKWVVAGDHDRADSHFAKLGKSLDHALFHGVLQVNNAEHPRAIGDHE